MLTVRIHAQGEETIFQADRVVKTLSLPPRVEFLNPQGLPVHVPITTGEVFVMNDEGRTVAIYRIGPIAKGLKP